VDEIGCLVDFVGDGDALLGGLEHLATLSELTKRAAEPAFS
jgi:hypothetical protein